MGSCASVFNSVRGEFDAVSGTERPHDYVGLAARL